MSMIDQYSHFRLEDFTDVVDAQNKLLEGGGESGGAPPGLQPLLITSCAALAGMLPLLFTRVQSKSFTSTLAFVMFSITFFESNPVESWLLMKEYLFTPCWKAQPNEAHRVLARLEQRGIIKAVITQNIDNLHHRAGSQKVIEVHGNIRECICLNCRIVVPIESMDEVQRCKNCECVMKPNCTLFGEDLPREAWKAAVDEMNAADVILVIGTSGEVMPASNLTGLAVCHGGKIININPMHSNYESIARISISMKASAALKEIGVILQE